MTDRPLSGNLWLKAVDDLVQVIKKKYDAKFRSKMRPVTVALIDDGVDIEKLGSSNFFRGGWHPEKPTPEHGYGNAWTISEDGHGTEMVGLIQRVCPFVRFYVCKLDTHKRVYDNVAKSAVEVSKKRVESPIEQLT